MYRTINAVLNRRLITLLGSGGMGKSALAAGVVNYLALRKSLPDGIVMVRLQGKTTLEQLVQVRERRGGHSIRPLGLCMLSSSLC